MDVLVLIDKLDDLIHNARPVPLTDQVRVDREEIYDLLDQMRATIPEEIKQARWIVKERQEMLAEAKREAERVVKEARDQSERLISSEEVYRQAERAAEEIIEDARETERQIRLGAEDYADEILSTLEVNLEKFLAAVQRGRGRRAGRSRLAARPGLAVGRADDREVVALPADLPAAPIGERLRGGGQVEAGVDRSHAALGLDLDHVADHQRARLLADAAKQIALALVVEVVDREHRDHQVPRAVGQRILHPRQADLGDLELAGAEDHLGTGVERGHPGLGVTLQQPAGGLAGADAELEHPAGSKRDRVDRGLLQLLVTRHLRVDQLEVVGGVPVKLRGHGCSLS